MTWLYKKWLRKGKFHARTSSEEAVDGKDLTNKVAIVTGANSGLGKETSRVLLKFGATVIMGCRVMHIPFPFWEYRKQFKKTRNAEKAKNARDEILSSFGFVLFLFQIPALSFARFVAPSNKTHFAQTLKK